VKIILAPMEGVVDPVVRQLFTAIGGIDYCVTEFLRVTSTLYPNKVFYKNCPELHHGSRTATGTPVFLQILGSDLVTMGENAHKAAELGAYGIDINFGCPAKTVNRHDGGASLLKDPERVFQVTSSVRRAVPAHIPVTTKVRLGFADKSLCGEIAQAAEAGGAHWLTVHARTKMEAYRPPAHWEYIQLMKEKVQLPLIANGEIWTPHDHKLCQQSSGCEDTMIGRGLMAQPDLARQIRFKERPKAFFHYKDFFLDFIQQSHDWRGPFYALNRCKQLCKLMGRSYHEAQDLFQRIKILEKYGDLEPCLLHFFAQLQHSPNRTIDLPPPLPI
jgi:tRNA-dihydrouridine synthase C